jgi:Sortase domain
LRHDSESRDPSLTPLRVRAGVAALLAMTAVGMAGCSAESGAAVASSAPASSRVASASVPAPAPSSRAVAPRVVEAAHLKRSVPIRLQIAAIGVDSKLMDLGLRRDGTLEVPPSGFPAGWFTGMPTPGELGPAIIVGHVDWNGPGVFYGLHNLKPGDRVTVTRKDGSSPVFRVTRVEQFPKDQFPTKLVYGNIDHAGLRLITCGGTFNRQTGHYEDNIVAFADLVAPAR